MPLCYFSGKNVQGSGPSPFRFQQMWVDNVDFNRCVQEAWEQSDVGSGLMKLAAKLKRVKVALKGWNKEVFGWTIGHIQELEKRIEWVEEKLQMRYEEEVELVLIASKMKLDTWMHHENVRLAQCAKVRWWGHGDKNSRYFHAILNKQKQERIVEMSLPNGSTLRSPMEIYDGAVQYFMDFLGQSTCVVLPDLSDLVANEISEDDNSRPYSLHAE
ncbi:uncharacterized protein LOC121249384 [Juglans microcarpa x Juglans regia]|uniref:uncharacterized protein LOC121249384 n=1 Tax=Juglans microcarpa x Juglans regia TaxID=2249226 RepID=UPI001B7EEBDC|nr:uncharacterized protein LOC121249384 [Juglans microcarpa x Juglans regia]